MRPSGHIGLSLIHTSLFGRSLHLVSCSPPARRKNLQADRLTLQTIWINPHHPPGAARWLPAAQIHRSVNPPRPHRASVPRGAILGHPFMLLHRPPRRRLPTQSEARLAAAQPHRMPRNSAHSVSIWAPLPTNCRSPPQRIPNCIATSRAVLPRITPNTTCINLKSKKEVSNHRSLSFRALIFVQH